ncbi:hypothetical protein DH2020_044302 [Rehmannia glutinosa]|uniref:WRKY domain-containing protein n=1 Tax=Rehmannia glutinosa TaxID=99300 RepID=A0ABR0UHA2_REHGL
MATKLQTLLHKPVKDHGTVSAEDLALKILTSFTQSLSVLTASAQIPAVDGGGSDCSGWSKKKPGVKDRRGCYKRRKTSDSWMTISPVMEDGYAWRKYGQKVILNSEYPRCYFRCTYKYEGCKATKQVQRIKENPVLYQTTYFNHHTCTDTPIRAPPFFVGSDPVEPNLLSFQTITQSKQDDHDQNSTNNPIVMTEKEDQSKEEAQISEDVSDAKSSVDLLQEFIGSESFGFHSCGPISLHGLDMDVNQFGDLDTFHFDEIY